MTEAAPPPTVLFHEQGASWWWLSAGPGAGIAMALIQLSAGYGIQLVVPGIFFVLVSGFLWIQVKAARIHTSVELTPDYLRQGTESLRIDNIVRIYPEPTGRTGAEMDVLARPRRAHRCAARAQGHRPEADQRSNRAGVGA